MVEPTTAILSRDELLCVLGALNATSIPGLDSEPGASRSDAESALVLEVATRGLRARGLAAIHSDGRTLFHDDLLAMVGSCVYPQSALFIFYWPHPEAVPGRYFGHIRESVCVAHTRPEDILHRFDAVADKRSLIKSALNFCAFRETETTDAPDFTLPSPVFAQARDLVEQGEREKAIDQLVQSGVAPEQAKALVDTMINQPRYSIWQTVKEERSGEESRIVKRDFTLIQNSNLTWFVGARGGDVNESGLRIKIVTKTELIVLVDGWL